MVWFKVFLHEMKQEISPDALFGGAGLEWGRHIAVEDRRPTCVFAMFPNSTPCPQSASLPSLEGPLTALDWLTGCFAHRGPGRLAGKTGL